MKIFKRVIVLLLVFLLVIVSRVYDQGIWTFGDSKISDTSGEAQTEDHNFQSGQKPDAQPSKGPSDHLADIPTHPSSSPELTPDQTEELPVEIRISFAGDCTLGMDETFTYENSFQHRYEKVGKDPSYFFRNVKHIFESDDLTFVNLETTFTKAEKKANKRFRFKGDPEYVNILLKGSVEMVNIANNHIYDYLEQGFKDTLQTLNDAGVLYSGEGYIAYYEVKGVTIGSIGYSYSSWTAEIKDDLKNDIEEVRKNADIVIVSFHWGIERDYYPNAVQLELGRLSIDLGADVVIGHHPHVIQGIDKYKGKYIVYSLGNFCFGGNRNPADKDTFIFQNVFTVQNGEIIDNQGLVYPCSVSSQTNVNDYQPTLLKGQDRERVINRLLEYSSALKYGITENDVTFLE